MFDWGDTVMKDDPSFQIPMVDWPHVQAVPGVAGLLQYLQSSGRRCILATSAEMSSPDQIRAALARVDLDSFFERIYSFTNTGLPKGEPFYRHILADLGARPADVLMIGDSFQKDVLASNSLYIYAIWFNPRSMESHNSDLHKTLHSMEEIVDFFHSLDRTSR
jgi:FMN phosphatase YigB (HAD superfamily)